MSVSLLARLLVCCWIYFCDRTAIGITTKNIPLGFANGSDSSQYVQIRTNVNHHHHHHQGPRNPLHHPKNVLSPVQQTHILDDVQKNQRIHYHPASNFDNALPPPPPPPQFDQSHIKYANFLNLNSLSPPPVQTVVLSPQQTLPTTPPHVEPLPYFRPITHADTKSSFPHTHSVSALGQIEPLKVPAPDQPYLPDPSQTAAAYYQPQITSTYRPYVATPNSRFPYFSKPDPLNPYTFEVTLPPPTATATATASPNTKSYLTKDPSSVFTPLVLKPAEHAVAFPSDNNKVIKEIVIRTNPEELIAKDRQKFFQQLLGEDKTLDESGQQVDDQTVAQNDLTSARGHFEQELIRQLKESISVNAPPGDFGPLLNSSSAISEFSLPDGQRVQISKDYNRLLENDEVGVDATKIKTILFKQPSTTTASPASPAYLLEELTKGVIPPGADFEVIKRNNDGRLEEVNKLPPNLPQKKVTFVILEEQSDGSVKVQGVRGSEKDTVQESSDEVDTIIRKIKEGELKLPPSTRLASSPSASAAAPKPSHKPAVGDKIFKHANRLGSGSDDDLKSKRKATSSSDSAGAGRSSLKQRLREQEKYFIPTPVGGQSATTETILPETYLTPGSTSYQYYSSPTSYYEEKYKNEVPSTASSSSSPSSSSSLLSNDVDSHNHIDSNEPYLVRRVTAASSLPPFESSTSTALFADNAGLFHLNNSGYIANLFSALKHPANGGVNFDNFQFPFLPTTSGSSVVEKVKVDNRKNGTSKFAHLEPTVAASTISHPASNGSVVINEKPRQNVTFNVPYSKAKRERITSRKTTKKPVKDVRKDNDEDESNVEETKTEETTTTPSGDTGSLTLSDVLKKEGFYAMAKFLKQSGLDSILNDTGPFTLFIPTDKAFRTLLIQLGGPDKAEEKFKDNPRLLSGLLLHHVIPGAFRVNTLQDEMTGVSLAGTQLRVNTYTTHDIEWNDITVVTVNGAKILDEKDIVIPQGIAHAIDRVMFPLPVGNLLQSLQADRENRYSNFLKILDESELSHLLTGSKTFTLFAPLNRAFTHAEFTKIISSPSELKSFVLRHLVPGALYSAGMKYYQVRDSMEDGQQVTVYKEAGKIKVNTAHVITRNIPATNGVIHAIDAFL